VLFYLKEEKAYAFRRNTLADANVTAVGSTRFDPGHFDHLAVIHRIFTN